MSFGTREIDVTAVVQLKERLADQGHKISETHIFAHVLGKVLEKNPEFNSVLRFGRPHVREDISLFLQVAVSRTVLSGFVIQNPHLKAPEDIAKEARLKVQELRTQPQPESKWLRFLPSFVLGIVIDLLFFLIFSFNLNPRLFGLNADPFGSMRLNNLAPLGLDHAVAPYVPWMHSVGSVLLTRIRRLPRYREDSVTIEPRLVMNLVVSSDHRLVDGIHYKSFFEDFEDEISKLEWQS